MVNVTIFGENEADFSAVESELDKLAGSYSFQVFRIDIHNDPVVQAKYQGKTPVVLIGPYTLSSPVQEQNLRVALGAAADREKQIEHSPDDRQRKKRAAGRRVTGADRFGYWFSRHYMWVFNIFLALYVGLPFLAPVLMKAGAAAPAKVIYTIYSPLCHQLPFRSWFLFGEQPFYPRALAGIPGEITYEQISGSSQIDLNAARSFVGDETVGYKVALCERDVAIYGSLLLFGLVFSAFKNRIRPVRWYIWIVLGLIPIGLDGASQIPSLMNNMPAWMIMRESTPFLRSLTGTLFGVTTAWYLFPLIEMSMHETREILFRKLSIQRESTR